LHNRFFKAVTQSTRRIRKERKESKTTGSKGKTNCRKKAQKEIKKKLSTIKLFASVPIKGLFLYLLCFFVASGFCFWF